MKRPWPTIEIPLSTAGIVTPIALPVVLGNLITITTIIRITALPAHPDPLAPPAHLQLPAPPVHLQLPAQPNPLALLTIAQLAQLAQQIPLAQLVLPSHLAPQSVPLGPASILTPF
jgi:hypothetical protein